MAAKEIAQRVEQELSRSEEWFRITSADDADYVVLLSAIWEKQEGKDSRRCVSAAIGLPGQQLGLAIDERGPNWRKLETLETAASQLARDIAELFRKSYYRLLNLRAEGDCSGDDELLRCLSARDPHARSPRRPSNSVRTE